MSSFLRVVLAFTSVLAGTVAAGAQSQNRPANTVVERFDPRVFPPGPINSPWTRSHRSPSQQASTPLPGPAGPRAAVQVSNFLRDTGKAMGTSPFHVLSSRKYPGQPTARTIWGATLTDLYKYEIDGDTFRIADRFELNTLQVWIGWNLFGMSGDRIVVPNPSGLRLGKYRRSPCYGTDPSLLVFQDGATPGSPITCVQKFEFSRQVLQAACGWSRAVVGTTAIFTGQLQTGEVAVSLVRNTGTMINKRREGWMAILDPALTQIVACTKVDDTGSSNQFPIDPLPDGSSLIYVAADDTLNEMRYDPRQRRLMRLASVALPYRQRTGTTPTLMGTGAGGLVITVDGRCAVDNVFTGAITCSQNARPSRLIALRKPLGSAPPIFADLPDFIDTVENSPAVAGRDIVVANYSGYRPDGPKDGRRDFARGIVKLSFDPKRQAFQIDWANDSVQINSVTTISTGSNRVYGSGAEADGITYFYGFRMRADASGPAGELVLRQPVGPARESRRGAKDEIFDAGNNIVISDDGSAIWPAGNSLVRIR